MPDEGHPAGVAPEVVLTRLLEVFLVAPLEAGAKLVNDGPGAIAKVRQDLSNARFLGEMVVTMGVKQLRTKLSDATSQARSDQTEHQSDPMPDHVSTEVVSIVEGEEMVNDVAEMVAEDSNVGSDLALPDYDHLPAIDIVAQLPSLSAEERAEIEAYERANRRRRTVLGKLSQLEDVP